MPKYNARIERLLARARARDERHRATLTDTPAKQHLYAQCLAVIADLERRGEYIRAYRESVGHNVPAAK